MKRIIIIMFLLIAINVFSQNYSDFIFIKGGKFKIGNNNFSDEKPVHKVVISDFYIQNHEVTNAEYVIFLNEMGNQFEGNTTWINTFGKWRDLHCRIHQKDSVFYVEKGYENYPVTYVCWYGANAYCNWAGGRLPTEAEWEFLAQKSVQEITTNQDSLISFTNAKNNSNNRINQVKSKPSVLGIYDLFGNMAEWCSDWYSTSSYKKMKRNNPIGVLAGRQKVYRGGSWATNLSAVSATNRRASAPDNNNITIGFRVVIPIK